MISILLSVYNNEKYLEMSLKSIKAQTYSNFEVIMLDNGSTAKSGDICNVWSQSDERFKIHHTENNTPAAAVNIAKAAANGEYLFFMNSDVTVESNTLELLLKALNENGAEMSMGKVRYKYEDNCSADIKAIADEQNMISPVKDEILTNIRFLEKITERASDVYNTLCGKLLKKELLDDIVFTNKKNNEDETKIHEIAYKCKKIVTINKYFCTCIMNCENTEKAEFSPKSLDKEAIFIDRIKFFDEKGLNNLAASTGLLALDSAVISYSRCIDSGFFYGKTKKFLLDAIELFYKHAKKAKKNGKHDYQVMSIGWAVLNLPYFYEKYISMKARSELSGKSEAVKEFIFDTLFDLIALLPTKKRIVFESHPELMCNTYPVYKYLLDMGLNKEYEFIWLCNDEKKYSDADFPENVRFMTYLKNRKSFGEKIKYMKTISTAKALVYSNQFLGEYGKGRVSLWLQHGMPLKASNGTYCIKNKCTAALCEGEFFADNYSSDARVEKDKMIFFGFPRNDYLNKPNDSLKKFGIDSFDKIIFWLPTYRQRKDKMKNKTVKGFEMENRGTGIPSIETAEDMIRVNEYLKRNNCLIILKPHPVQDVSAVSEHSLSNFLIINDDSLKDKELQLYELLGSCDAMITDYSSVYYDYLLTGKPIGLTIGDIDEYIEKRGFVYKNPLEILKGEYIYDTDCLLKFIENVKNSNDVAGEERKKVAERIHSITDGNSSKRVGDYIIEQISSN